ncbi:MAG: type II secretion system protein, partial [Candidatus Electrothrix sp. AR3]|nr:type II secretion system protein [Candidatus Electrothrix sp. AR3]
MLSRTSATGKRGFTLIELIVVMVLISLTASFVMPRIRSSLFTNELTSTVRRFVGLVAETAQDARLKQIPLTLRFDTERQLFITMSAGKSESTNKKHTKH